jgi:hypothetical protein
MALATRVATSLILSSFLLLPRHVSAQSPAKFGLEAGASVPVSAYGSDKHTGYHLGILVDIQTPLPVFGFRIEGAYHEMKYSGSPSKAQIWTAAADGELKIPTSTPLLPYVIGGVGIYSSDRSSLLVGTGYRTQAGVNIGGGLRLGLGTATVFVETRYHRAIGTEPIRLVPITIGMLF